MFIIDRFIIIIFFFLFVALDVVAEKAFYIASETSLVWKECGMRCMWHPQSLLVSSPTDYISVSAIIGGDFRFPKGCSLLVSGLYLLSFPVSPGELVIEIEHCVQIRQLPATEHLRFVHGDFSNSKIHFSVMDGGDFGGRYGKIALPQRPAAAQLIGIVLMDRQPDGNAEVPKDKPGTRDQPNSSSGSSSKEDDCSEDDGANDGKDDRKKDDDNQSNVNKLAQSSRKGKGIFNLTYDNYITSSMIHTDCLRYIAITYIKYKAKNNFEFVLTAIKDLSVHKEVLSFYNA